MENFILCAVKYLLVYLFKVKEQDFFRWHPPLHANHLSYKYRNDLNISKKKELESTFIKTANPKK